MTKKIILLILFFYFLTLFQTSFLVHFSVWFPNVVLLTVFLINFFEEQKESFGIVSGFIGGFFLDIFSERFIGYYIFVSILLSLFIKFMFKRYVAKL